MFEQAYTRRDTGHAIKMYVEIKSYLDRNFVRRIEEKIKTEVENERFGGKANHT